MTGLRVLLASTRKLCSLHLLQCLHTHIYFKMSMEIEDDPSAPQVMMNFYRRLYPFKSIFNWLNHQPTPSRLFTHREFAFTLPGDVYIRYNSFANVDEFKKQTVRMNPSRFEIGAVYSARVCDCFLIFSIGVSLNFSLRIAAPRQKNLTTRCSTTLTTRTCVRYRYDRLRRDPNLL